MSDGTVPSEDLVFREGRARDLHDTFALSERALSDTAQKLGIVPAGTAPDEAAVEHMWQRSRSLVEFMAAQEGGSYWVCESDDAIVGYARVVQFGSMEELTEVMVEPEHHGRGIGRALLQRCWPEPPTPDLGRIVVAAGSLVDLSLYTEFGTMPSTGHWHLRQSTERFMERRAHENTDVHEEAVHVLKDDRAVAEWKRLEPQAIGHERPRLHEFFGRERSCLATVEGGQATGLCWVSPDGDIGPAVGVNAEALVPVALAALDRVAKTKEPEQLGVFCTTESWWLLRRLRELGFRVFWPSWIMCSVPLPGLDRYLPTRPAYIL
jgi:N-acetylglutamate synthase-like GNAT family acetyltransferase